MRKLAIAILLVAPLAWALSTEDMWRLAASSPQLRAKAAAEDPMASWLYPAVYVDFDGASPTNDLSGNNRPLTLYGSVTISNDVCSAGDGALYNPRTENGSFARTALEDFGETATNFTIAATWKQSDTDGSSWAVSFGGINNLFDAGILINPNPVNELVGIIGSGGGKYWYNYNGSDWGDSAWHSVVCVFLGTNMTLVADGVNVGGLVGGAGGPWAVVPTNAVFCVGARPIETEYTECFKGWITRAILWTNALTDAQAQAMSSNMMALCDD